VLLVWTGIPNSSVVTTLLIFGLVGPIYQYFCKIFPTPISPAGSGVIIEECCQSYVTPPRKKLLKLASTNEPSGQVGDISYVSQK